MGPVSILIIATELSEGARTPGKVMEAVQQPQTASSGSGQAGKVPATWKIWSRLCEAQTSDHSA